MVVDVVVIGPGKVCCPVGVPGVGKSQAEGGIEYRLADARIVHELRPARGVVAVPPWGQATPPAVQSREQVIGAECFLGILPPEVRHQVLVPLIDMSIAVNNLRDHMCGACACGCHGGTLLCVVSFPLHLLSSLKESVSSVDFSSRGAEVRNLPMVY